MSGRTGPPRSGKVDLGQREIVDALRAAGVVVRSLAGIGDGMNDLLCAVPQATFLIEVKKPGEKLTAAQKRWHAECPWRNHLAYSVDDALRIAGFYRNARVLRLHKPEPPEPRAA